MSQLLSCFVPSFDGALLTRRCVIASVTIVSAGSRERLSLVSPMMRRLPRFRIAEVRSVEWFSKTCVVRSVAFVRRRSTRSFAPELGNRRFFRCCYFDEMHIVRVPPGHCTVQGRSLMSFVVFVSSLVGVRFHVTRSVRLDDSYLVDPASSHMLVSKIKPCMSKYKLLYTVKLRMAH